MHIESNLGEESSVAADGNVTVDGDESVAIPAKEFTDSITAASDPAPDENASNSEVEEVESETSESADGESPEMTDDDGADKNSEDLPAIGDFSISQEELLGIVEALVFGAEEALSASRICDIIVDTTGERPSPDMIDHAVDWLNSIYEDGQRSFRIQTWGGGYRMATDPQFAAFLKAMYFQHRETKLSRSLLETLAILAYKQPTTKPEIDHIRGVDSDYAIRRLMELGFVEIGGRSESVGKPLLYKSTELFMDKFGLASLEDLPTLREMEELLNDPSFSSEKAHLLMKRGLDLPEDEDESNQLNLLVSSEAAIAMPISDPSEIISETADASSGDGAPTDTDLDPTNLSGGVDTSPDVN